MNEYDREAYELDMAGRGPQRVGDVLASVFFRMRQGYRPVVVKRAEQLEPIGLWSDRDRDGAMIQRLERMARWLDGRPAAIVADMLWQARRRRYAASDAEWSAAAPSQRNASSAAP